jgi:hypothetical protein
MRREVLPSVNRVELEGKNPSRVDKKNHELVARKKSISQHNNKILLECFVKYTILISNKTIINNTTELTWLVSIVREYSSSHTHTHTHTHTHLKFFCWKATITLYYLVDGVCESHSLHLVTKQQLHFARCC